MVDHQCLVNRALAVREHAYVPYSGFRVGAALLCEDGEIFTGVNVENVSYGAAICAERSAVIKAVSEGKREFSAIAVASDMDKLVYPCGICRQVLTEFKIPIIIAGDKKGNYKVYRMEELLPHAFTEF
jgi:cytidine deaminase